jgi:mono/diheme cytochrome c family protein
LAWQSFSFILKIWRTPLWRTDNFFVTNFKVVKTMTGRFKLIAVLALLIAWIVYPRLRNVDADTQRTASIAPDAFLEAHCYACHNSTTKKANLDLTALKPDFADEQTFATWVKVHDRVRDGEMPPKSMPQPEANARAGFLKAIAAPMIAADAARIRREGRAVLRRMNRHEYENTLRDLLGAPWLQVKELLPEDGERHRFNKSGEALGVSHVQISRYLTAAEYALREVIARSQKQPETLTKRYYARDQRAFTNKVEFSQFNTASERATFPLLGNAADVAVLKKEAPMTVGDKDPAKRELESMGVVASSYEPLEIRFNQFKAPVPGRYKLRLNAHSFWAGPESAERWWRPSRFVADAGRTREPITLYAEIPPRQMRYLANVDVAPEASVQEVEVYLLKDETIRPDAVRLFRSRPPNWRNPLAEKDGQPGVAFRWLEVTGPIHDEWPSKGHRLMFGDLPIRCKDALAGQPLLDDEDEEGADAQAAKRAKNPNQTLTKVCGVKSNNPHADAEKLLRNFLQRAYRHSTTPAVEEDTRRFLKIFDAAHKTSGSFTEAMITAYSAVLCSPAFTTLEEKPGRLDDHALASRLSYFLWNSEPDANLRELAAQGALRKPAVLRGQMDRMLSDPKSQRFVNSFLDYWLDLRKVNITSPDELLYNDYYLDDHLVESATAETRAFFAELIRRDLPARNVIASDFVTINERLAAHYGLPGVAGSQIRRVALPPDSVRGGLLTQASVLKVTANGTTTSPVVRGAWMMERILGKPVPPPPPGTPAVEPDIRGATTLRQQLEKHRTDKSCNACHAKMDPAGFALENFDVFGGWQDKYRALADGEKAPGVGKNGQRFAFRYIQPVDASGSLPDGQKFQDVRELKRLLLKDERQIARNLTNQLLVFATGASVQFSDRPKVEGILDRAASTGYGVKSLIQLMIESELFRNK